MSDEKTDTARLRRGAHKLTLSVEVEPDGPGGRVDGLALEVEALAARRAVSARDVLEEIVTDAVVEAVSEARNRGQRRRLEALEKETAKLREELGADNSAPVAADGPYRVIGIDPGSVELAPCDDEPDEADEADELPPEIPRDPEARWGAAKERK